MICKRILLSSFFVISSIFSLNPSLTLGASAPNIAGKWLMKREFMYNLTIKQKGTTLTGTISDEDMAGCEKVTSHELTGTINAAGEVKFVSNSVEYNGTFSQKPNGTGIMEGTAKSGFADWNARRRAIGTTMLTEGNYDSSGDHVLLISAHTSHLKAHEVKWLIQLGRLYLSHNTGGVTRFTLEYHDPGVTSKELRKLMAEDPFKSWIGEELLKILDDYDRYRTIVKKLFIALLVLEQQKSGDKVSPNDLAFIDKAATDRAAELMLKRQAKEFDNWPEVKKVLVFQSILKEILETKWKVEFFEYMTLTCSE